jgi:MFS transporter, AAHS family, 4-hydroxybenzoate transporter
MRHQHRVTEVSCVLEWDRFLDELKLTRYHYEIFVVCILLVLIDGYDGATLAYAAPAIVADIKLDASALGPLFAAHLVGMVLGSGSSGLIADRYGRRPTIICATFIFGLFTLLMATASSFHEILIYRLLTGVGLGAAVSNVVAFVSESSPGRCRATVVSVIYSSFPLGALVGGYIGVWLIRAYGWRSIFQLGGCFTMAVLVAVLWKMPESIRFLRATGAPIGRMREALVRFGLDPRTAELPMEPRNSGLARRLPMRDLFVDGNAVGTLLLWLAFFVNQLVVYFMFTWMPIVFKSRDLSSELGIVASATLNLGGVVGAICLARLIDARGAHRVLTVSYVLAFFAVAAFGRDAYAGVVAVLTTVALTGFVLNGSNVNLAAVATSLYPTRSRSTGVGWAMGIGRVGGITGSLCGGVLLRSQMNLAVLYTLVASPLLLSALGMWLMHLRKKDMKAAVAAETAALKVGLTHGE